MITIGEMQFGGMLTMGLLALTLAFQVPRRSERHVVFGRARWLMAAGLALMSVQFLLQYTLGLRQMGITQAVLCNLLFFMPSSVCISLAILYLQRRGRLSRMEWSAGWVVCGVAATLLLTTLFTDGLPLEVYSWPLRMAEYVSAGLYILMQAYYFLKHFREYQRMCRAVDEYYDRERDDLLRWMDFLAKVLAVAALFVPLVIFSQDRLLIAFSAFYFFSVYYCAVSFYRYGVSSDSSRVEEAQQSGLADTPSTTPYVISPADSQRVAMAAERWIAAGGYHKPNLTLTVVAADMGLQRYLLKAWLQNTEWGRLSNWVNHLRTEEAKQLLVDYPEWSLDVVADKCGFSNHKYFYTVFRQLTGLTPSTYQQEHAATR